MRFEAFLAWRYLRSSPGQTALTVGAVAVAVTVVIFINCLIDGLQTRLLNDNVGSLAHVTIKVPPPDPVPLRAVASPSPGTVVATRVERLAHKRRDLDDPARVEEQAARFPGVVAVSSAVRGQAFLLRGARKFGVTVSGADPERQERIVQLQDDMVAGRWQQLGTDEIVMGFRLAEEAGVGLGDRVRLTSPEGISAVLRVAGIFDTGTNAVDLGQVFVTLRTAQSLFATGRSASSVMLKLEDPFQADQVADAIRSSLGYETESWMREQAMFVNGFRAQDQSRTMISFFSLLAAAFGIASVLVVSVIRKSREIGILKSMGARSSQVLVIFTLQGLFVSLLGALAGCVSGGILLALLAQVKQVVRFGKADQLFPVAFEPSIFLGASAAAVAATLVAALLPARRAASMNPVDVIRGE